MGEVFLASTTGLEGAERPVVVKVIRRDHVTDPSFLARFLDEARVQAQLQHSGVAQVLEAALDPESGEPYAVVEHVEGKSLGDVRSRAVQIGKQIGWADAVAMATLVAEALAHVHERLDAAGKALAIVHRDLSPQNVMVSYTGDAKIIDFGTARGQNRRCHTVSGVVFAKPGYVAPEVANGDSGDAKVDVYALGIMLWELCAGRRFLQGDANVHMAQVARNAKTPPPLAEVIGAPVLLDAILAKLTAHDKEDRPTARQASLDLARLLAHAPALASGERSIRARTAELMATLFPGEPGLTRREFGKLVASAHRSLATTKLERDASTPKKDADVVAQAARESAEQAANEPEVGELLAGTRWRLVREIGRGASSIVYEGQHVDLGKSSAIKVLGAEASRAGEFAERFRREARALSHLHHPSLISVLDVGVSTGGRLFCVMDRLEGETLEAFLAREKGLDWREAFAIADKVLAALEVAHGANLVHRDVKPANVFLLEGDGVKVLDFGLAKTAEDNAAGERRSESSFFGTPEYMAPEQAASGRVDARADLYGVGAMLYEMLAGVLPFSGASAMAILDAKLNGSPEPLRARAPKRGIPEVADDVVMRALARHANSRFQTATEMRRAIQLALEAPTKQRAARRLAGLAAVGLALAASAFVLAGGRVRALERYFPHPHGAKSIAAEVAAAEDYPQGGALGVIDPNDSWARAERGEDPIDEPAVEPFEPPPDVAAEPETDAPPKKGPVRAHPRKRKGEVAHKSEKLDKKHAAARPAPEPSIDDEPKPDADKDAKSNVHSRRKKKNRLAHVEE
jgi:serine/threonine-protein kinase